MANWNPKTSLFKGTAPTEFQQLAARESVGTVLPCMCAKLPQSCLALCDSVDYSPLDFSVHRIFQARILEWVPWPPAGDLPDPETKTDSLTSPALAGGFFTCRATGKPSVAVA